MGTTTKWSFDVEIEKMRAEVLFACGEDKNYALLSPVSTYKVIESKNYKHENTGAGP